MATDGGQQWELRNDTAVNVVGLLKGQTGATRSYRLLLDSFEADGETIARDIAGDVRLTRLRDAVIARVSAAGVAPMICARCLREYDQRFEVDFDEEYRQTVDVRTGFDLGGEPVDDELVSRIDENHELDLREPLRQEILWLSRCGQIAVWTARGRTCSRSAVKMAPAVTRSMNAWRLWRTCSPTTR